MLCSTEKESSSERDDILTELSHALNRLQATLLNEQEPVTDTRKRNTILTLVAWLKKILQSPSSDIAADTPIFSLTDLLPTELLLTKLMPQLTGATDASSPTADRSSASSKRFSRQRNKRFNTVGVSKEELADARLFFQKKLLSENLASAPKSASPHTDGNRKTTAINSKSLNDEVNRIIGGDQQPKTSKSIDLAPDEEHLYGNGGLMSQYKVETSAFPNRRYGTMRNMTTENEPVANASKSNGYHNNRAAGHTPRTYCDFTGTNGQSVSFDANAHNNNNNGHSSEATDGKPMNKFSLRKMKIKRANTIDIPKKDDDIADVALKYAKAAAADTNFNRTVSYNETLDGLRRTSSQFHSGGGGVDPADKNKVPPFEPRTRSDMKFMTFMNKQPNENRLSWISHNNKAVSPQLRTGTNNWTNKFDNIKSSFEKPISQSVSPASMIRKNQFNHASTSPFIPVNSSKLPSSCGPSPQLGYQSVKVPQVHKPIPSVASNYYTNQQDNFEPKPRLQTQKSLPATNQIRNDDYYLRAKAQMEDAKSDARPNTWSTKYASMDNTTFNNVVNKLRSPVVESAMPPPIDAKMNGNSAFTAQLPSAFNPLYIPLHQNGKPQQQQQPQQQSPALYPNDDGATMYGYQPPVAGPKQTQTYTGLTPPSPQYSSPYQTSVSPASQVSQSSPITSNNNRSSSSSGGGGGRVDFPKYTYTSTDYTRPACVSTYIPNQEEQPAVPKPHNDPRMLVESNSSSEYLSDSNSSRSPQPFYTPVEQIDTHTPVHNSGEYTTAKSQVMKYPSTQMATVMKPRLHSTGDDAEEDNAKKLHSFLRQNVHGKRPDPAVRKSLGQLPNEYLPPIEATERTVFSQVNQSYIAPIPPFNPNYATKSGDFSNYAPMKYAGQSNLPPQHITPPMRTPSSPIQHASPVPPSVIEATEAARKAYAQAQADQHANNQSNAPAVSQPINRIYDSGVDKTPVPLTRTKPTTTTTITASSAIKVNSYGNQYMPPKVETDKNALWLNGCGPKPDKPTPAPRTQSLSAPKAKNPDQPPPHPVKPSQTLPGHMLMNNISGRKPAEVKRKQSLPSDGTDFNAFIGSGSDSDEPHHKYLPTGVLQRSKSGHTLAIMKQFEAKERSATISQSFKSTPLPTPQHQTVPKPVQPPPPQAASHQQLHTPKITETPSTPTTEQPADEFPQPGMVRNFIQSINNSNIKKSSSPLQRSKSNHTLSLPKQYEGAMKKAEVMEKERTVAAYFGGLQRSSSQHNMVVRSSMHTSAAAFMTNDHNSGDTKLDLNSNDRGVSDRNATDMLKGSTTTTTTTTSTKSAHHLKILKRSQQSGNALAKSQTMPHISSIQMLDESNVDDAFEDLFKSFT